MAKLDTSAYKTFDDITGRLDKIVADVRDKDTSLEHSLDLFDEAIALGSKAVDMVDSVDFSPAEQAIFDAETPVSTDTEAIDLGQDADDTADKSIPDGDLHDPSGVAACRNECRKRISLDINEYRTDHNDSHKVSSS